MTELKDKVYPEWDSAFTAAVDAAKAAGLTPPTGPAPDRQQWQHYQKTIFTW
jgi:hypothetical protein